MALTILNSPQLEMELSSLRFDASEIQNVKTTFMSILDF
jgi:hypothetical protein